MASTSSLPPDLFDQTTLISLASTVAIVVAAYATSRQVLPTTTSGTVRFLFIWHLADALCHFILEGSFLYHCFFSHQPALAEGGPVLFPTPQGFLGTFDRVYGAQSGGSNPFAQLWMVYAKADKRWAGVDLGVVSLELLTVFFDGPLAVYVCYCLAKRDPKASIWMIILATCELYGGFMTFCPEWLTGNVNLDGSNFMYLWVYLVFFNMLWVFIPLWVIWYSVQDISGALHEHDNKTAEFSSFLKDLPGVCNETNKANFQRRARWVVEGDSIYALGHFPPENGVGVFGWNAESAYTNDAGAYEHQLLATSDYPWIWTLVGVDFHLRILIVLSVCYDDPSNNPSAMLALRDALNSMIEHTMQTFMGTGVAQEEPIEPQETSIKDTIAVGLHNMAMKTMGRNVDCVERPKLRTAQY
ncbi:Emopamil-binding protein-like [Paramyrothecium foliicola]|nr:Emopamil-binding protein-like [Paramyrothecium foliicola]